MMKLIDTHSHLYVKQFAQDRDEVVERAKRYLQAIILPNIDESSIEPMLSLGRSYPEFCYPALGLHPCSVNADYKVVLHRFETKWEEENYWGVGECGLDFHWDLTYVEEQKDALHVQVEWAKSKQLPLILHTRKATDETIALIKKGQDGRLKGVFHCFSGTVEQAEKIIGENFLLGIGGVLTYKNAGLDKVLSVIPLNKIVLETDSPYLAPVPYRGKRNESAYTRIIAQKLADVKGCSIEEVIKTTTTNAIDLFNLPV